MVVRWLTVIALVSGGLVAGCSGSSAQGSARSSTSASTAPVGVPQCQTSQLRASFVGQQGTTGHYHAVLVLTNTGGTSCESMGYVGLQMLGPGGQPLMTSVVRDTFNGGPATVVLPPAGRASSALSWVEISSGEVCTRPDQVTITPPGEPASLTVPWPSGSNYVCGQGAIDVRPLRSGVALS